MKSTLIFRSSKSRFRSGFTLVELMVAIAVLGILILILAQIFGIMNKTWVYGQGKVNNFTKARAMLNVLQNDLGNAIFRPDLAAFPPPTPASGLTVPPYEFYTRRPGIPPASATPNTVRNISLVKYALKTVTNSQGTTCTLERSDMPELWTSPDTDLAFGDPNGTSTAFTNPPALTPRDTAPGVIAFEIMFVQSDGTFSTTKFTPEFPISGSANAIYTRGIGATLVVIDDQAMKLLSASQITALQSGFTSAISSKESVKADWEKYLANGIYGPTATVKYPNNLATGIGIYECYKSIP